MIPSYVNEESLHSFLIQAFQEDVGDGDHSTLASIPEDASDQALLLMKDNGVIAGIEMTRRIINFFDPGLHLEAYVEDGVEVQYGDLIFKLSGAARSLLTCERIILNCMQRMSGIATKTRNLVEMIEGTGARLLDTRKTTPNFRLAEKWAVSIGGGTNHRYGLFDMIMLKDNHIDYAGGIAQAISATKEYLQLNEKDLAIEVETRNIDEVKQVLEAGGVQRIMLDNMSVAAMKEAVALIAGRAETEASGGITETTIREVAETGVDFISVGALTHSVKSLDMSLKASKSIEK